jgi:hypothetical protein
MPLPNLSTLNELQLPAEFDFGAFDEAALLGGTPPLFVEEAGAPQQELGFDHLHWLPSPLSESLTQHTVEAGNTSTAHQRRNAVPGPSGPAAVLEGRVHRKAEQNRYSKMV